MTFPVTPSILQGGMKMCFATRARLSSLKNEIYFRLYLEKESQQTYIDTKSISKMVLNFTFRKSNYRPDMASNCHHHSF